MWFLRSPRVVTFFVFVVIPLGVEVIVEVVFGCIGIPLSVEVIEVGVLALCLSL